MVAEGFWRIHSKSTEIHKCPLPEACVGGVNFTESDSYLLNAAGYCKDGYFGPMCGVCINDNEGPYDDYYFNPDAQTCDACLDLEDPVSIFINSPTLLSFTAIMVTVAIIILRFMFCTEAKDLDSKVRHHSSIFETESVTNCES